MSGPPTVAFSHCLQVVGWLGLVRFCDSEKNSQRKHSTGTGPFARAGVKFQAAVNRAWSAALRAPIPCQGLSQNQQVRLREHAAMAIGHIDSITGSIKH
jgi:hypothetical protein